MTNNIPKQKATAFPKLGETLIRPKDQSFMDNIVSPLTRSMSPLSLLASGVAAFLFNKQPKDVKRCLNCSRGLAPKERHKLSACVTNLKHDVARLERYIKQAKESLNGTHQCIQAIRTQGQRKNETKRRTRRKPAFARTHAKVRPAHKQS
jgi:hypothetical protein